MQGIRRAGEEGLLRFCKRPQGLGAGPGAGRRGRSAAPVRLGGAQGPHGAFPPLWAGLAAPLRESAQKPGGRLRHYSISGVGGREAQGQCHPAGFSLAARASRVILGPPGLLSNDLPCSSTLSKCLPSSPNCPPFFWHHPVSLSFHSQFYTAVVCTHSTLFFTTHSRFKPDSVTSVASKLLKLSQRSPKATVLAFYSPSC